MPTPDSLAADVEAAARAAIADAASIARQAHEEEVASSLTPDGAADTPPGEGWTASAFLTTKGVADIVGRVLMQPLSDLQNAEPAFEGASTYPGTIELSFFRALGRGGSRAAILALLRDGDVAQALADGLWDSFAAFATQAAATATELHNKFVDEGTGFDLEYAGLKNFFSGLEAVVGAPSPQVYDGMKREHCRMDDSIEPFNTPNYKMTTTSRIEWWFVADPVNGLKELRLSKWPAEDPSTLHGSAQGREAIDPSEFRETRQEKNRVLEAMGMPTIMLEEFIGARLYTGPTFVKYNATLRGLQSSIPFFQNNRKKLCKDNLYTTTLHTINSAIVKLSKLTIASKVRRAALAHARAHGCARVYARGAPATRVPEAHAAWAVHAQVYRGVSGGRLPAHFRIPNEFGVRGGIDPAFMSTTLDREVALTYAASSGGPGVVFSIQQGMVDRGADIGWLSQVRRHVHVHVHVHGMCMCMAWHVHGMCTFHARACACAWHLHGSPSWPARPARRACAPVSRARSPRRKPAPAPLAHACACLRHPTCGICARAHRRPASRGCRSTHTSKRSSSRRSRGSRFNAWPSRAPCWCLTSACRST